ncbi:MAG: hypothetical protein FWG43_01440 [Clostridiales bacterium]|nr:hypothetical protein [Clostridiales bacterium]
MEDIVKRKLKRRNRWADAVAAIILMGALILGIFALRDYVRGKSLNYDNVEAGTITITLPAQFLVLRHESIINAPAAGSFISEVAEGARVKEGSLIGYCKDVPVYAHKGGAISYLLDGWENKLAINSLHELDWLEMFNLIKEDQVNKPTEHDDDEALPAGRPIARVVDNLLDYSAILLLKDPQGLLAEENRITVKLPEGQMITSLYQERWETVAGDLYYIFNKIPSTEFILFKLRYSEVEIVIKDVSGIIIPSSAITMDDKGKTGVFIRKKRMIVFTEIEELAQKNDFSVVNGLSETDVIVSNPSRAKDRMRI